MRIHPKLKFIITHIAEILQDVTSCLVCEKYRGIGHHRQKLASGKIHFLNTIVGPPEGPSEGGPIPRCRPQSREEGPTSGPGRGHSERPSSLSLAAVSAPAFSVLIIESISRITPSLSM